MLLLRYVARNQDTSGRVFLNPTCSANPRPSAATRRPNAGRSDSENQTDGNSRAEGSPEGLSEAPADRAQPTATPTEPIRGTH